MQNDHYGSVAVIPRPNNEHLNLGPHDLFGQLWHHSMQIGHKIYFVNYDMIPCGQLSDTCLGDFETLKYEKIKNVESI